MEVPPEVTDLLKMRPLPGVAAALRARKERILQRWTGEVDRYLPHADPLTRKQVRDSIPMVLEKIAMALETATSEAVAVLQEVGTAHGVARYQQNYNIEEVIIEYRLFRTIVLEELHNAAGSKLSFADSLPVNTGVDTALHRGVVDYVRHLTTELKSAAEAESRFLAFLSHDLRNNLSAVTLMLQALQDELSAVPQCSDAVSHIETLQSTLQRTIAGMNRLLEAERLRRQDVALQLAPVDLRELVSELIQLVSADAQAKGLRIENAVPAEVTAQSDRDLLTLVLQNLLGNAVKYSTQGSVRIDAQPDPLGWRLAVSDRGPGIDPQRVAALYEAFTRGESHGQAGMGLGLSIASRATRLLGSELSVQSELGKGSTFSFTVPPAA
jgi:signal transduction histidine kinase